MERKDEIVANEVTLGDIVYKGYKNDKNPFTSKKMSAFQLKMAVINGSQDALQEVNRLVKLYLSTENYERALPYCKIVHFNDKKGLENTVNLLLSLAVKNNNLKNARLMINSGADVNRIPEEQSFSTYNNEDYEQPEAPSRTTENTLLHIACFKNNSEMAALLMLSGAEIFEKNAFSQTPMDVNPSCFNNAWLLVHGNTYDQNETVNQKLEYVDNSSPNTTSAESTHTIHNNEQVTNTKLNMDTTEKLQNIKIVKSQKTLNISSIQYKELTIQAEKHFEYNMSDSSDDLELPPLIPTRTPENNLLHIACFKNDPVKAASLMSSGTPLFDKNKFNQTPREINPLCFDTAWLIMHDKIQDQEKAACEKLDLSLDKYLKLTTQAKEHINKHNLQIADAEEKDKNTILENIRTKYFELLEQDKQTKYGPTFAKYPDHKTINDVLNHAFKNVDQVYTSTLLLFRQEDRSLRALKALNYITYDNKLSDTAPLLFKKEFESRTQLKIADFVLV